MKLPKEFVFIRNNEDAWIFKKLSGSWMIFLKPYVDDILLVRNDLNFLTRIRTSLEIVFSWRTWADIALVLSTVIYEDNKCLIMLNQHYILTWYLSSLVWNTKKHVLAEVVVKSCLQKSVLMNTDKKKHVKWIPLT